MNRTTGVKGRMTLREAIQGGGRSATVVERNERQPRDQLRLLCAGRNVARIDRVPARLLQVRIPIVKR